MVTKQGNVVKELETEIKDLEEKLERETKSNNQLRDNLVDAEWRLRGVLDLLARVDLRKLDV